MTAQIGRLYQLQDSTVVRVMSLDSGTYTLARHADGTEFTVNAEGFDDRLREGYVQRVEVAGYRPV